MIGSERVARKTRLGKGGVRAGRGRRLSRCGPRGAALRSGGAAPSSPSRTVDEPPTRRAALAARRRHPNPGTRSTPALATTALAAAIVMSLARMVASRGTRSGAGARIAPGDVLPATRIQTPADVRVRQDRILDRASGHRSGERMATRRQTGESRQRQFSEVPATEIDSVEIDFIAIDLLRHTFSTLRWARNPPSRVAICEPDFGEISPAFPERRT